MATIASFQREYVQDFPEKLPQAMVKGFLVTTAVSLVFSASIPGALATGAVASLATLIEAITRPIFKQIFNDETYPNWGRLIRSFAAGLTLSLNNLSLNRSISLYTNLGTNSPFRFLLSYLFFLKADESFSRNEAISYTFTYI